MIYWVNRLVRYEPVCTTYIIFCNGNMYGPENKCLFGRYLRFIMMASIGDISDEWLLVNYSFLVKKIATVRRSHILQEINWSYFVADSIGILTTAMGKGTDLGVLRVVDRCGNLCQQTHRNIITYMQLSPGNALKSWLYFTNRSVYAVLVSKPSLKTLQHLNWLKSIFLVKSANHVLVISISQKRFLLQSQFSISSVSRFRFERFGEPLWLEATACWGFTMMIVYDYMTLFP